LNPDSQKTSLIKIFSTNFLDLLGFGLVIPVYGFLFYPDSDGLFTTQFSVDRLAQLYVILMATFSVGTFIGAPFIGALSDKFGRRRMLMFTYSMNFIFYFVFIIGITYSSYWILWLSRLGAGLTGGSLLIVQSAIADVSSAEEKAKNFGITGVAFGLGFILGAFLSSVLSNPELHPMFGNTMPFIVANIITALNILFLVFVFKETNHDRNPQMVSLLTGPRNIIRAIKTPSLRHVFIVIFLITLGFNFFLQLFQFYVMDQFSFDRSQVSYLFGFIGICIALAQGIVLPLVSNRYSPKKILSFSLLTFSLSYLIILLPNYWFYFAGLMVLLVLCQALTFPPTLAVVSNLAGDNIQGETIGINQSVQSLAAATPILFSLLITSNYSIPMYVGFVLTGLAWIYFMIFVRNK